MKFFKNYIVVCVITILSIGGAFAQNDGEEVMRDELDRIFRGHSARRQEHNQAPHIAQRTYEG